MRFISFLTSHWNNPGEFLLKWKGEFGIEAWCDKSDDLFPECRKVIACGTWSESIDALPLVAANCEVFNAGIVSKIPYDIFYWQYCGAAATAGFVHCLNRRGWDMLVWLDNDCLVGSVDFDALLREFWERPELMMSCGWHGMPGGPFMAWKREALERVAYANPYPSLILDRTKPLPKETLLEGKWGELFRGAWWNPWPDIVTMRMDYPGKPARETDFNEAMKWPFVRQPAPHFVGPYRRAHQPKPFVQKSTEVHSLAEPVGP